MFRQKDLSVRVLRARFCIMLTVLLSIFNIYFILQNNVVYLPYSSSFSTYALVFSKTAAEQNGTRNIIWLGIILSIIVLAMYIFCYFRSKKNPLFLLVAYVLTIADTALITIILLLGGNTESRPLLDTVIHVLMVFYINRGIDAYKKLLKQKTSDSPLDTNDDKSEIDSPIAEFDPNGCEELLAGRINGYRVIASLRGCIAELVINGYVCDSLNVEKESKYSLCAIINDIEFSFYYNKTDEKTFFSLCADGDIFSSKTV